VVVLGLIMSNRGLTLTGINISPMAFLHNVVNQTDSPKADSKATVENGVQVINMSANGRGYTPNILYVQKNVPVKWVINGDQLTSCNNAIVVPSMNIQKKLESGENIITFTPGDKDINFSCWMGMIGGVIRVVDDVNAIDTSSDNSGNTPAPATAPSIYGTDLATTPIDILVKKAKIKNNTQSLTISGIGYELTPIISSVRSGIKTNLSFDLSKFDNADGKYLIVASDTSETIASFEGKKDIVDVAITFDKPGVYAIVKNNFALGLIEVTEDIEPIVLEELRDKYLK